MDLVSGGLRSVGIWVYGQNAMPLQHILFVISTSIAMIGHEQMDCEVRPGMQASYEAKHLTVRLT